MGRVNPDPGFWKNKKVFITGHTGFKGSWLCLYLNRLGADIYGYALEPNTNPSLFKQCKIEEMVSSCIADVRDKKVLTENIKKIQPEIVFHLAAQPLVRCSYKDPRYTYETNINGTINLMEAIRETASVKAVVNVTTDKCYDNKETLKPYVETDALGGYDPYSSSKACSEIISASYRNSFFNEQGIALATARAGNVVGGGDWSEDRLIPDLIRSILNKQEIQIRYPDAIRPWQHVLEPLTAYILLAEKLFQNKEEFAGAWNFGPSDEDEKTVEWIVQKMYESLGINVNYKIDQNQQPHEAKFLKLDSSKALKKLKWKSRWTLSETLDSITNYIHSYQNKEDIKELCFAQIDEYLSE